MRRRPQRWIGLLLFGVALLWPSAALAQADLPATRPAWQENHTPRGALWRAAVLPGWGQLYNRQYYKIPFVHLALGGLIYLAFDLHDSYVLYRQAFQYKAFQELVDRGQQAENPKAHFKGAYDTIAAEFGAISSGPLRSQRDNFRRNRDFSIIGSGVVYMLSILDAYVSAHLLDFDIDENLSFSVSPHGVGWQVRVKIAF